MSLYISSQKDVLSLKDRNYTCGKNTQELSQQKKTKEHPATLMAQGNGCPVRPTVGENLIMAPSTQTALAAAALAGYQGDDDSS